MPVIDTLDPHMVVDLYREMLETNPDRPVTYRDVAEALERRGIISRRTKRPFTRQGVEKILNHKRNEIGTALVQESKRRRRANPRYAGLQLGEEPDHAQAVEHVSEPVRSGLARRARR